MGIALRVSVVKRRHIVDVDGLVRVAGTVTMPPIHAIITQVYGVRYVGILGGIVFFSHQIWSFLWARLGRKIHDAAGKYNTVLILTLAWGVFAGLIHLPIDERLLEIRAPVLA
jgi:hypothetical protein